MIHFEWHVHTYLEHYLFGNFLEKIASWRARANWHGKLLTHVFTFNPKIQKTFVLHVDGAVSGGTA